MSKPTASEIDLQLGLRLKKCRQQAGLSAAALAEATGSTQQQISRYENGQNKISAAQLFLLASHLGVPVSWFFLELGMPIADQQDAETSDFAVREPVPSYLPSANTNASYSSLADDTANLQALWPRLNSSQRSALLRLLDSLIQ